MSDQNSESNEDLEFAIKEQHKYIADSFKAFLNWLDRLGLRAITKSPEISFEKISLEETLKVDSDGVLHFNLEFLKICSIDYFVTILLHEVYHVYINGIPNKRDAVRVRDFYQNQMMLHIDIEADYYVAKFFKEHFKINFKEYLKLYYNGANAFRDDEIRPLKFERFVGSMLTIYHLFKQNEMAIYRLSIDSVIIHETNPIAIIHKGSHSEAKKINLDLSDLSKLKQIYHEPDKFEEEVYVDTLNSILSKSIIVIPNIEPSVTFNI